MLWLQEHSLAPKNGAKLVHSTTSVHLPRCTTSTRRWVLLLSSMAQKNHGKTGYCDYLEGNGGVSREKYVASQTCERRVRQVPTMGCQTRFWVSSRTT